jgi:hypothetical protein
MQAENNLALQETERARLAVNLEVVRLLQEKTVPLNRGRYLHLQKISKALCREPPLAYASTAQLTLNLPPHPALNTPPPRLPRASSTGNRPMLKADLLLERLNTIKSPPSSLGSDAKRCQGLISNTL